MSEETMRGKIQRVLRMAQEYFSCDPDEVIYESDYDAAVDAVLASADELDKMAEECRWRTIEDIDKMEFPALVVNSCGTVVSAYTKNEVIGSDKFWRPLPEPPKEDN